LADLALSRTPPALNTGKSGFKEFIILTAAVVLVLMHLLVTRTIFGRHDGYRQQR
jgi:hypothetical protein